MFKLRDYQQAAKDQVRQSFGKGNKRVVLCMPTGAGKTVTFADMVARAISGGSRAMILCDRKELIGQANDKIQSLGLNPTIIAPRHKQIINNCYLASVDTLRRREIPEIDLLIIDEAHKQSFDSTLERYIEAYDPFIIGATATPHRTGNQNCLSNFYQDIVEPITVVDLLERGFLVPARTFAAKTDFSDVKTRGADFDTKALFDRFNESTLYDGVVDNYLKFSKDKKAICFNVNVEHSEIMVEKFKEHGISAAHLDGKTPDAQRREILKDYSQGKFKVLSNCSVLTTGFDEPSIETVIVNRATKSLPLWLQMIGRGSRLFQGKPDFTIIDQGANVYKHGLYDDVREWKLHKPPKRNGDGVAPVKVCEQCGAVNHSSATKCSCCSSAFPVKEKKLKKAEFVEIQSKRLSRGILTKPDPKTATLAELRAYGDKMGYSKNWAFVQLRIAGKSI